VIRMVAYPELPPDDGRHPLGGPDITAKAECLGPLRQQQRDLRPLLRRQLRHGSRTRPALQRLDSTLASAPHPLADGPGGDPQRLRNLLLAPALRLQRPRSQPALFTPLLWLCCFLGHTAPACTARTSVSVLRGDQ